MDIIKVKQSLEYLEPLLTKTDYDQLKFKVGQAIIDFHEGKAENNYKQDLVTLGIDMKLEVDVFDF
jgi:hypothetical protein